jgi:hypothetical protein
MYLHKPEGRNRNRRKSKRLRAAAKAKNRRRVNAMAGRKRGQRVPMKNKR